MTQRTFQTKWFCRPIQRERSGAGSLAERKEGTRGNEIKSKESGEWDWGRKAGKDWILGERWGYKTATGGNER